MGLHGPTLTLTLTLTLALTLTLTLALALALAQARSKGLAMEFHGPTDHASKELQQYKVTHPNSSPNTPTP